MRLTICCVILTFASVLARPLSAQTAAAPATPEPQSAGASPPGLSSDDLSHPFSDEVRAALHASLESQIERATAALEKDADDVGLYSSRGDAYFFRGDFKQAAADYTRMTELNPELKPEHWRRGIALFYAGDYKAAARQFELYHSYDNVDRENGIWRYLSQHRAYSREKAREGLLKYEKDDREPFPAVYKLFAGEIAPAEILRGIEAADISPAEREKRLFYAHLYIGLNAAVEGNQAEAIKHLRRATVNSWGPRAGYGPRYMWHVGRLHYELLTRKQTGEQ